MRYNTIEDTDEIIRNFIVIIKQQFHTKSHENDKLDFQFPVILTKNQMTQLLDKYERHFKDDDIRQIQRFAKLLNPQCVDTS